VGDDDLFTNRDSNLDTCGLMEEGADKGEGMETDKPTVYNKSSEHIRH
jgi:hypothetical protein